MMRNVGTVPVGTGIAGKLTRCCKIRIWYFFENGKDLRRKCLFFLNEKDLRRKCRFLKMRRF